MRKKSSNPAFEVRSSAIHGHGVFAVRRIRPGTQIVEYTGERVSNAEADRRYASDNGSPHDHTVLFALDDDMCIDAGRGGNAARFINHSCNPNCESVEENGRIFIEAIRNIQPGVELTYDYQLTGPMPRVRAERERYACACGAPNCRGIMVAPGRSRRATPA